MEYLYEYKFKPRYADLDYYQIAHHSKYFCWFEDARYALINDFLKNQNVDFNAYLLPITRVECKYIRSVNKISEMYLRVKFSVDISIPVMRFDYRLYNLDDKLCAKAYTENVMTDKKGNLLKMFTDEQILLFEYFSGLGVVEYDKKI